MKYDDDQIFNDEIICRLSQEYQQKAAMDTVALQRASDQILRAKKMLYMADMRYGADVMNALVRIRYVIEDIERAMVGKYGNNTEMREYSAANNLFEYMIECIQVSIDIVPIADKSILSMRDRLLEEMKQLCVVLSKKQIMIHKHM